MFPKISSQNTAILPVLTTPAKHRLPKNQFAAILSPPFCLDDNFIMDDAKSRQKGLRTQLNGYCDCSRVSHITRTPDFSTFRFGVAMHDTRCTCYAHNARYAHDGRWWRKGRWFLLFLIFFSRKRRVSLSFTTTV